MFKYKKINFFTSFSPVLDKLTSILEVLGEQKSRERRKRRRRRSEGAVMHTSSCQLWRSNCLKFHLQHFSFVLILLPLFLFSKKGTFPFLLVSLNFGIFKEQKLMGKKERGGKKSRLLEKPVGNSSSKFEKKVFAPTFYYVLDLSDQFSYWNPR